MRKGAQGAWLPPPLAEPAWQLDAEGRGNARRRLTLLSGHCQQHIRALLRRHWWSCSDTGVTLGVSDGSDRR